MPNRLSQIVPSCWKSLQIISSRRTWLAGSLALFALAAQAVFAEQPTARLANVPSTSATPNVAALSADDRVVLHFLTLIRNANEKLASVDCVQCMFHKQERVDGELQDLNIIQLKVRRSPLSAYMRWETPSTGQEAIWQQGANDNQVLAHPAGWKRRVVPLAKLDPLSERAMENNRRPITEVGIWNMVRRLLDYAEVSQLKKVEGVRSMVDENAKIAGRDCCKFTFIYSKPLPGIDFHKVHVYFDKETGIPIALQNYGFPGKRDREPPIEESYVFHNMVLNAKLTDMDFSIDNPNYQYNGR